MERGAASPGSPSRGGAPNTPDTAAMDGATMNLDPTTPSWHLPRPRKTVVTEFWRVFVKAFHSLAVVVFALAAGYLIYCGITGQRDALMVWALVAVAIEATVYAGFGRKCPLTMLARWLNDEGGHDYLFEWLLGAQRIMLVSRSLALLAGVGVLLILIGTIRNAFF